MIGMKFRIKISDLLLHIATLAVIILSLVLWVFLMTNDQRSNHIAQPVKIGRRRTLQHNFKSLRDLYLPTRTYGYRNGDLYQLYDSKRNLPLEYSKEGRNVKVEQVKLLSQNERKYDDLLKSPDYLQLTYPDQIYLSMMFNLERTKQKGEFNRIFMPENSNDYLILGNDENKQLYRLQLRHANFDKFRNYTHHAKTRINVSFVKLKSGYCTYYDQSFTTNIYSYLIDRQDNNYFVSRLLGTSGVSSKTNRKGQTTYSVGYNSRLRVPKSDKRSTHNYLFTDYEHHRKQDNHNKLLDSIYYVHSLGLMEQDLRFFEANDNSISYTNFINGLPVFLNQHDLQVQINFEGNIISNKFNDTNLQIPIPANGEKKTVPATATVINSLNKKGLNRNNIEKIILGLQARVDRKRDNLVVLEPTYYIKAYGQWRSVNEWQHTDIASLNKQSLAAGRED